MQRIKKGDLVQVISGNEIGAQGEVKQIVLAWQDDSKKRKKTRKPNNDRVIVAAVNIRKKHQKRTGQTRTQTGIIEVEAPIHISNVMLVCPSCDEAVRVRFSLDGDKKVRMCKKCDAPVDK